MRKTKVCYILSYYSPNYVRTLALTESLKLLDNVELFEARNTQKGFLRYFQTLWRLFIVRIRYNPEVYILGFRGHEIFVPVKILTLGKKLIFDEFMSPYDSYVNERKEYRNGNILTRLGYALEKFILKHSDKILTDTDANANYISKLFAIARERFVVIPVGTDEKTFMPAGEKPQHDRDFTVFFYATYLPLHGVEIIIKAAELLQNLPIKFVLDVAKRKHDTFQAVIDKNGLKNLEFYRWIEYPALMDYIKNADVCLGGPFGDTPQTRRVFTGKSYQFLAAGKPVIVADTNPHKELQDKIDCIKVKINDPVSLAEGIRWAYNNQNKLEEMGKNARKVYEAKYSNRQISLMLAEMFKTL